MVLSGLQELTYKVSLYFLVGYFCKKKIYIYIFMYTTCHPIAAILKDIFLKTFLKKMFFINIFLLQYLFLI